MYASKTLTLAWEKVRANRGAAGVDGQSIERFEARSGEYLAELSESLKAGQYRPLAIRRVEIPKDGGSTRPLGIPAVKDRIVQTAVKLVIEPVFEVVFHPSSYGFRPGRSCKDALREVAALIEEGYRYVVDADLKGYFDSIPHERLMERVRARIGDGRVLDLLEGWLKQDIVSEMGNWTPTEGTPQGAVISPFLANVYLHPLDELMAGHGYKMVRYADDFVVLCQSREEAEAALALIRAWVAENGALSCESRKSVQASAVVLPIGCVGPALSSQKLGCSHSTRLGRKRDAPDEETANWRAVCGKTARTVRREGRPSRPYPYRRGEPASVRTGCDCRF